LCLNSKIQADGEPQQYAQGIQSIDSGSVLGDWDVEMIKLGFGPPPDFVGRKRCSGAYHGVATISLPDGADGSHIGAFRFEALNPERTEWLRQQPQHIRLKNLTAHGSVDDIGVIVQPNSAVLISIFPHLV